ncbi:MAG: hypothetical protein ABS69_20610 [Nitrosomonadales bacterium SCN 54-20]|nr:MAG: hypothetical protein ABS69_20610 [Nitrosomonadales bacterium SCN 54-20]
MNHSRILPEEALNKSQASKFTAMLLIGCNVGLAVSLFRSNSHQICWIQAQADIPHDLQRQIWRLAFETL